MPQNSQCVNKEGGFDCITNFSGKDPDDPSSQEIPWKDENVSFQKKKNAKS